MAYEIPGFSFPLPAGADLRTSLFRGVTTDVNGKAVLPAAGRAIIGVINNKPGLDEAVTIVHSGIVMAEAGAAIPLLAGGTPVMTDALGRFVPYVVAAGNVVSGWALEPASGAGIITTVILRSLHVA